MIRTTRLSFLGVFLLAMCVFFPIVGWPGGLFWLAIIPIAALVWIVRTQTTVSPRGLDLRSVFSSRHIDWAQVRGLSIPKRGFVRAHLDDDTEVSLPAVSYDRLRDLVDASGGRIPDPFAIPDPTTADSPAADSAVGDSAAGEAVTDDAETGDSAPGAATANTATDRSESGDSAATGASAPAPRAPDTETGSTSGRE
ncbi:PH domain-containing protein [Nocardia sp. NBC_01329]|uniref:PH domain-containing protein n=1 Tax=Nocardia sp. NBC_01329 TaxID=2903594 RepID=UPI002E15D160|nr:PH domain-containing protein [Nocardia sp. NBC_01329]